MTTRKKKKAARRGAGGAREGAGRKSRYGKPMITTTVYIRSEQKDWLDRQGDRSAAVRRALDAEMGRDKD